MPGLVGQFSVLKRLGEAVYDPLITLAVAAGAMTRVALGTTVLIVPYPNAVVTAKRG